MSFSTRVLDAVDVLDETVHRDCSSPDADVKCGMRLPARLVLVCSWLAACGDPAPRDATAPTTSQSAAPPTSVARAADDKPEKPAGPPLRERVERGQLSGYVAVGSRVQLFASADAARTSAAASRANRSPHMGRMLRVLRDDGDVLQVSTGLGDGVRLERIDANYELTVFVRRADLLPVLRRRVEKYFEDGTGALLLPGLPVAESDGSLHPVGLAKLPVPVTLDDVGLGFEHKGKEEPAEALARGPDLKLGCDRFVDEDDGYRTRTRVDAVDDMVRELRAERRRSSSGVGLGGFGGDDAWAFRCSLAGAGDESREENPPPLRAGGVAVAGSDYFIRDVCSDWVHAYRDAEGVLVDVTWPRARLRLRAPESLLREAGGCGTIGHRRTVKVYAARGTVDAFFEDGTPAGRHRGHRTVLRKTTAKGDLECFQRPYLAGPLCHKRADLIQVEVSPY